MGVNNRQFLYVSQNNLKLDKMEKFISLNSLNRTQKEQYNNAISEAFPQIISESKVIKRNWSKLEEYFPEYQQLLISNDGELIGFINVLPFNFEAPLSESEKQLVSSMQASEIRAVRELDNYKTFAQLNQ